MYVICYWVSQNSFTPFCRTWEDRKKLLGRYLGGPSFTSAHGAKPGRELSLPHLEAGDLDPAIQGLQIPESHQLPRSHSCISASTNNFARPSIVEEQKCAY